MINRTDVTDLITELNEFLRHSIAFVFGAVRHYFGSFLLVLLLIAGGFGLYWYRLTPYFESDLVCSYNNQRVPRKIYGEMCQKLNVLAHKGSYDELSRLLSIPSSKTSTILSIDAKNMSGSPLYEDITENYQPLTFTLKATDRTVFEPFQNSLVKYLSFGPYQQQIGDIEIGKLRRKIAFISVDLGKIDTILDSYAAFLRKTESTKDSVSGFSNIATLLAYKDKIEDRSTELEQKLALQSAVSISVIHGFTPADRPEKNRNKVMLYGIFFSLAGATSFAVGRKILSGRA